MATEAAQDAWNILRDPSNFQWYIIPFLLIVIYIYAKEAEKKNWNGILAALAFWGMDWFNEIWNGLIFAGTKHSAFWVTPGGSAYVILIGLNIEITFMFAIMGIVSTKFLPQDKTKKILKMPNRLFMAILGSILCLIVEIFLNMAGALVWDYPFWSASAPWLIFLMGYFPFWIVAFWVYDMENRKKQIIVVATILLVDAGLLMVFIPLGII